MSEPVHIEVTLVPKFSRYELTTAIDGMHLRLRRSCAICERDTPATTKTLVVSRLRDGQWLSICRACAAQIAEAAEEA